MRAASHIRKRLQDSLIELGRNFRAFVPAPDNNKIVFAINPNGVVARTLRGKTCLWRRGPTTRGVQPPQISVLGVHALRASRLFNPLA